MKQTYEDYGRVADAALKTFNQPLEIKSHGDGPSTIDIRWRTSLDALTLKAIAEFALSHGMDIGISSSVSNQQTIHLYLHRSILQ